MESVNLYLLVYHFAWSYNKEPQMKYRYTSVCNTPKLTIDQLPMCLMKDLSILPNTYKRSMKENDYKLRVSPIALLSHKKGIHHIYVKRSCTDLVHTTEDRQLEVLRWQTAADFSKEMSYKVYLTQ